MMAKRLTVLQQRAMKSRLESARDDLGVYLDPGNTDCAVPRSAREDSENYLYTWVMTQIEGALVTLDNALEEE